MPDRIRVGVTILPDRPWAQAERDWRLAEDLGFDHAWTYDHLTWEPMRGSPWFAAVPTLVAAAMSTTRIGLGTLVSTPNNHHPAQLIREVLALHDISAGRFLLGVGAGGRLDAELTQPGIRLGERTRRFGEFVDFLDRLLREDPVTFAGEWYASAGAGSLPGPVNAGRLPGDVPAGGGPGVPLIVAANGPRATRLAVERGDGWLTYAGQADDGPAWWRLVADVVARTEEQIERQGRTRPLARYLSLDSCPDYAFAGVDAFEDALGRAAGLGFTDVICAWPRPTEPYSGDEAVVRAIAARR